MPVKFVKCAVEGDVDAAVAERLLAEVGAAPVTVYGLRGKDYLRERIEGYNSAARHAPWFVLVDLDHEETCAPALRAAWLPVESSQMIFRVAAREVESWLLADSARLAQFLRVAERLFPRSPDILDDPKLTMVHLAAKSRSTEVRRAMVPRPGGGREVGPAYNATLIDFALNYWRPPVAAERSPTLARARRALSSRLS